MMDHGYFFIDKDTFAISKDIVRTDALRPDPYIDNSKIWRGGSRLEVDQNGNLIACPPDAILNNRAHFGYVLETATNPEMEGKERWFPWIDLDDFGDEFFTLVNIIREKVSLRYEVQGLTVQILEYRPEVGIPVYPTPRTVHHDEVEFTSVTTFQRARIQNDLFILTERDCIGKLPNELVEEDIVQSVTLTPDGSHTLVLNDSWFGHAVLPIKTDSAEGGVRSVILIDYLRAETA